MYKKILLPTDGSAYADEEIERAIKLLADDGEIIVLSVAGKLTSSAFQSRSNVKKINKGLRAEAEDSVNHMVKKFPDVVKVTPMVKVGFPAEVINEVAEKVLVRFIPSVKRVNKILKVFQINKNFIQKFNLTKRDIDTCFIKEINNITTPNIRKEFPIV